MCSLAAGGVAGTMVDVSLFPLDTIKTRMQSQRGRTSMLTTASTIWRTEGPRGLWAGWVPSTVRLAGGICLYFLFLGELETVSKQWFGSLSGTQAAVRDFVAGGVSRGLAAAIGAPRRGAFSVRSRTRILHEEPRPNGFTSRC